MWRKDTSLLSRKQLKRRMEAWHSTSISNSKKLKVRSPEEILREGQNLERTVSLDFVPNNSVNANETIKAEPQNITRVSIDNIERKNLNFELRKWAIKYNISICATSDLLKVLNNAIPSINLPQDARTLLGTPRDSVSKIIFPGKYIHFGLENQLLRIIQTTNGLPSTLFLQINIDGLPIHKSSNKQLWPIQCKLANSKIVHPFVIGVYCGDKKPNSANEFMYDFIQ